MSKEIKRICLDIEKRPSYNQNNIPNKVHLNRQGPINPETTLQNREHKESFTETGENLHQRTRSVIKKNEIPLREGL